MAKALLGKTPSIQAFPEPGNSLLLLETSAWDCERVSQNAQVLQYGLQFTEENKRYAM